MQIGEKWDRKRESLINPIYLCLAVLILVSRFQIIISFVVNLNEESLIGNGKYIELNILKNISHWMEEFLRKSVTSFSPNSNVTRNN